jgi:hypothetical protein
MLAVDYRLPDGLTWGELTAVRHTAVASDHATGLDVWLRIPGAEGRGLRRIIGHPGRPGPTR